MTYLIYLIKDYLCNFGKGGEKMFDVKLYEVTNIEKIDLTYYTTGSLFIESDSDEVYILIKGKLIKLNNKQNLSNYVTKSYLDKKLKESEGK